MHRTDTESRQRGIRQRGVWGNEGRREKAKDTQSKTRHEDGEQKTGSRKEGGRAKAEPTT